MKKSGSGSGTSSSSKTEGRGKKKSDKEKAEDQAEKEKVARYHLPYDANVGYLVGKPDPGSKAVRFDLPRGTAVTAARSGIVVGISGPTPTPGEDMIFGRKLPRSAILIQHEDSSFTLYQNVQSAGIDSGSIVEDRTKIASMRSAARGLKLSISHPTRENYEWKFSTKRKPRGIDIQPGEVYLRTDSERDHPQNAVEQTYTAAAGDFRKTSFRKGETVRLNSRFAFPIRADIRYAFRRPNVRKLLYRPATLDPGRKSCHLICCPGKQTRQKDLNGPHICISTHNRWTRSASQYRKVTRKKRRR